MSRSLAFHQVQRYFTFATALWAFVVLACYTELHNLAIGTFLVFFVICFYRNKIKIHLSNTIWVVASIIAIIAALYGWFFLRQELYSVIYLFLYLECNKLWFNQKTRDSLQVYALTFFQILAASVSTSSLTFAPALIIYMFLVLGGLITTTIKRDAELSLLLNRQKKGFFRKSEPQTIYACPHGDFLQSQYNKMVRRKYRLYRTSASLFTVLIMILFIGTGLFFFIPRLQATHFFGGYTPSRASGSVSGFNDIVDFMGVEQIQMDPTITMRVRPLNGVDIIEGDPDPAMIRLRGTSLDYYDGRRWTKGPDSKTSERRMLRNEEQIKFRRVEMAGSHLPEIELEITVEPNSRGFLFGPNRPFEYRFPTRHNFIVDNQAESVQLNIDGWNRAVTYTTKGLKGTEYAPEDQATLSPDFNQGSPREVLANAIRAIRSRNPSSFESSLSVYKQLPDHDDMAVVRNLAEAWTEGIDPNDIHAKAKAIELELKKAYRYSLDISFASRQDHLSYFLNTAREGHCEYFATAMTLMLRTLDIPSRIVNGYVTDEWTGSGQYFLVRKQHAHSWVEAYSSDYKMWLTFDPTPSSGIGGNRIPDNTFRKLSRWWDSVKLVWYENVIDYDQTDQEELYKNMFGRGSAIPSFRRFLSEDFLRRSTGGISGGRLILILLVLTVMVVLIILLAKEFKKLRTLRNKTRKTSAKGNANELAALQDYLRVLQELETIEPRKESLTPLEFAEKISIRLPAVQDFIYVTRNYYESRYNGRKWTGEDSKRIADLLSRVQNLSKAERRNVE